MNNYDNEGNGLLFDFPKYKINKKIRLIELFGGIGSQAMALRDIGADFEYYRLVEFDKYAVQAYNAIHNTQHTTHNTRHTADPRRRPRHSGNRQVLLFNDLLFPVYRFERSGKNAGNVKGRLAERQRDTLGAIVGS